ncbi:MAG: IS21 family transposase [Deltaproteobacteria bacterium]|nr:IS21 family transposase [Deltaproteobacteria bacterium]
MTEETIYQIFRRWHAGQSISAIKQTEECDRKTIRFYVTGLEKLGYTRDKKLPEAADLYKAIRELMPTRSRPRKCFDILVSFEDEFKRLITDPENAVLPKTAFEIIRVRENLTVSYESFKRFARERHLTQSVRRQMIRIEMPPGIETQIDYGRVGLLHDPLTDRNRVVNAFCGILSHSRLPFVQFVFSQDQCSFTESIIDMFEYYGGATTSLSMDNLKAGVLKSDIWDPKLNKTCAEMADYYGVFIDPCRVGKATDKGKIERFVKPARQLFRKLKISNPTADIHELNRQALCWCRDEYGLKEHGTTKAAPWEVFETSERQHLKALSEERFECARWKEVPVHPDQFFEFEKKRYSLPLAYRHKKVWIRSNGRILRVFFAHTLIREYIVGSKVINYIPEDFPETIREMMNGEYPKYLLGKARVYGEHAYNLIESVLSPHAYLNSRRAQGMLRIMQEYAYKPYFNEVCKLALRKRVKLPASLRKMLIAASEQLRLEFTNEMSEEGRNMVRPINDFLH